MRVNKVVARMQAGEQACGCNLNFPSTGLIELAGLTPMARVPDIASSTILRFLDRGIMGITGPHITTPEKARQLADACRYVPRGTRSFGSGRGAYFGDFPSGPAYMEHTNDNILVIAQLEDVEVLQHLHGILAVQGIDLYTSGPQDIAQSLGLPGQPNHQRVKEFEARVRQAVHAAGKRMAEDVMASARATDLFLHGAREFLKAHQ